MSSTVISDKSEYDPRNKSVIITVNNDTGNVTIDQESIYRILEGNFEGFHLIQVGASQTTERVDSMASKSIENTSLDNSSNAWSLPGDMNVKSGSYNPDPLSSLSLEDIQKLDAALHSDQAKQIFGVGLVDFLEANHDGVLNENPVMDSTDSERESEFPLIVSSCHALVDHCYYANQEPKPKVETKGTPYSLTNKTNKSKSEEITDTSPSDALPEINTSAMDETTVSDLKRRRTSRSSRKYAESMFETEFNDELFNESQKVATVNDEKRKPRKTLASKYEPEENFPGRKLRGSTSLTDQIEDDNSDGTEEVADDDPNKLWCICRKPHNNRFMICCDTCEDWFHGKCVGVSRQMGQQLEDTGKEWYCPNCRKDVKSPVKYQEVKDIKKPKKETEICIQPGCNKVALCNSIFCSVECITQHADDALVSLGLKKSKDKPFRDDVSIIVFERKTGKVLTGGSGPHANNLCSWLLDNPTFEVIKPTLPHQSKIATASSKPKVTKPLSTSLGSSEGPKRTQVQNSVPVTPPPPPSPSPLPSVSNSLPLASNSTPSIPSSSSNSTPPAPPKVIKPKKTEISPSIQIFDFPKLTPVKASSTNAKENLSNSKNTGKTHSGGGSKSPALVDKQCLSKTDSKSPSNGSELDKQKDNTRTVANSINTSSTTSKVQISNESIKKVTSAKDSGEKKSDNATTSIGNVRISVKKTLKEALWARYETSKLSFKLSEENVVDLVDEIEKELFDYFKDVGQKYKAKYRSLIFNIKDLKNGALFKNILTKSISPHKLVRLSPEELASRELAEWRERETKHQLDMIKKSELERGSVFIAKTSDGEKIIEADDTGALLGDDHDEEHIKEEQQLLSVNSDTTAQHAKHIYDINCMVCSGKISKEEYRAKYLDKKPKFDKENNHDKVFKAEKKRSKSNRSSKHDNKKPSSKDLDVTEKLTHKVSEVLHEIREYEKETGHSGEVRLPNKAPLWNGIISVSDSNKFPVTAQLVSGLKDVISDELPQTLEIVGRINPEIVWDYIAKVKKSGTKEVVLIRFQSNPEDKLHYTSFYSYLYSKSRFAVVGNKSSAVKDFYVFPLSSHETIPDVLLPLNGPGFEDDRPNLLLGLVVCQKKKHFEESYHSYEGSYTPPLNSSSLSPDGFSKADRTKETWTSPEPRSYTPPLPSEGLKFTFNGKKSNSSSSSSPYSPGRSFTTSPDPAAPYSPSETISDDKYSQINDQKKLLDELNRKIEEEKKQLENMSTAYGERVANVTLSPSSAYNSDTKETRGDALLDLVNEDSIDQANSTLMTSRDPRDPRRNKRPIPPDINNHSGSSSSVSPPNTVFYQPYPPPSAPITSSSEWNDNYISVPYKKPRNSPGNSWNRNSTWQAENGGVWKSCNDKDDSNNKQWHSKKNYKTRESNREESWYH